MDASNEVKVIVDKLIAGTATDADIDALRQTHMSGEQITLQVGKSVVNIGRGQDIYIGDRIYQELTDEAIRTIIQTIRDELGATPAPVGIPQNLPRSGVVEFVGREQVLQTLHQQLQQSDWGAVVAIVGMGGIGKTELALQYALTYMQAYPGGLCWLQATGGDLGTQIVSFARVQLRLKPLDNLELLEQVAFCWR